MRSKQNGPRISIDARAIFCLRAAGGVSVLCLEVFLDPGDGTLGILSEVDVLFALGRQQRDAQAVSYTHLDVYKRQGLPGASRQAGGSHQGA